jgi:hypothetical protein
VNPSLEAPSQAKSDKRSASSMKRSGNVLIAHWVVQRSTRDAVREHLYSFERHSDQRCFYVNLGLGEFPAHLTRVPFDLVIFHNSLVGVPRWAPSLFQEVRERAKPLLSLDSARVALPMDEYIHTDRLSDLINEWEIDLVCSVAPESEWPTIYERVDRSRTRFKRVLTGYLAPRAVERIDRLRGSVERTIDIGYRARYPSPSLGRHGVIKGELGPIFARAAAERGLSYDISTSDDDVLYGDDWYRFLLASKYTPGAEGGASILDRDGTLVERTADYTAEHPDASFAEVEAACFPGLDGSFGLRAISPRHLEACATHTCQILVEGDYNGILKPEEHYIPLREDLSNLDQVLDQVERDDRRAEITERAYRDVVASGRYTYEGFVTEVITAALGEMPAPRRGRARWGLARNRLVVRERASKRRIAWRRSARIAWRRSAWPLIGRLSPIAVRILPDRVVAAVRRMRSDRATRSG